MKNHKFKIKKDIVFIALTRLFLISIPIFIVKAEAFGLTYERREGRLLLAASVFAIASFINLIYHLFTFLRRNVVITEDGIQDNFSRKKRFIPFDEVIEITELLGGFKLRMKYGKVIGFPELTMKREVLEYMQSKTRKKQAN